MYRCDRRILAIDTEDDSAEREAEGIPGKGMLKSVQAYGEDGTARYFRVKDGLDEHDAQAQLRLEFFTWLRDQPESDLWACNASYDAQNLGLVSRGVSATYAGGGYTCWRHPLIGDHTLFDSHALIPKSVAQLGEEIDLPKLPFDPGSVAYAMRDPEIVCKWLVHFRRGLEELDPAAGLRATTGATAGALWRAMGGEVSPLPRALRAASRSAYRGGRVEVIRFKSQGAAEVWDIRSAFPAAMAQGRFPAGAWTTTREIEPEGLYDVTVSAKGWLGPLPVRCEGTNVYPVGTFRGTYWGVELLVPGVKIEELHAGWTALDRVDPFSDYVGRLWRARQAPEKSPAGMAAKLLLNSLYGIIGHNGTVAGLATVRKNSKLEGRIVAPDVIAWRLEKGESQGTNPAWSGLITARVRARLYQSALAFKDRLIYMDTDSLFLKGHLEGVGPVPTGKELGEWRLQSILDDIEVVAPKVYAMKFLTSWRYRAKGIKLREAEDFVRNARARWRAPLSIIQAAVRREAGDPNAAAGEWRQVERALRAQYRGRFVHDEKGSHVSGFRMRTRATASGDVEEVPHVSAGDGTTEPWDVSQLADVNAPDPWDAEEVKKERGGAWGKRPRE